MFFRNAEIPPKSKRPFKQGWSYNSISMASGNLYTGATVTLLSVERQLLRNMKDWNGQIVETVHYREGSNGDDSILHNLEQRSQK
jgi:hypothetical protein